MTAVSTGSTRPSLPPEGEANLLDDHPFDLTQTPPLDGILVEQVSIPMTDGVILCRRPCTAPPTATSSGHHHVHAYGKNHYNQSNHFSNA